MRAIRETSWRAQISAHLLILKISVSIENIEVYNGKQGGERGGVCQQLSLPPPTGRRGGGRRGVKEKNLGEKIELLLYILDPGGSLLPQIPLGVASFLCTR